MWKQGTMPLVNVVGVLTIVLVVGAENLAHTTGNGSLAGELVTDQGTVAPPQHLHLSLRGAMEAAAQQNPTVLLSKERIEAAKGEVLTQLGAMLPNLSSNVRQTRQTQFLGTFGLSPVRTDPFSIFDTRINASQNLFSLSLIQRWRASREALHVAEFESDASRFDTMASVALAYLEGLKAAAAVTMRQANQQVIGDLLTMVKLRQRGGAATGLDTARLEGQLANEQQQVVTARAELDRAKNSLMNLLGIPFEVSLSLTDELKADVSEVPPLQAAWDDAIAKRPEVQAQFKRVRSAELTYESTTGERLPSLVAQGDYGLIGNRWGNTLDTYNMALLLQIPIFDGAQREGRIATARSQWRQEVLRTRGVLNQVRTEVNDARIALTAANEQAVIAQAGLQAAMKESALARERYAVLTTGNQFEITNAITALARARENLVGALFQLNAARVNLARATGRLDTVK